MLPFLERKNIGTILQTKRAKGSNTDVEVAIEQEAPDSEMDPALKEAAADILAAIQSKSVMDLAKAIKAAFEICDAMPHEEGPHEEMAE